MSVSEFMDSDCIFCKYYVLGGQQDLNCWATDEYTTIDEKESNSNNLGHQARRTVLVFEVRLV